MNRWPATSGGPNTVRDGRWSTTGHASADISHVFVHWDNSAQSHRGAGGQRARPCVFDPDWTRPLDTEHAYPPAGLYRWRSGCRHANWALLRARQLQQAVSYRAGLDHFAGMPLRPAIISCCMIPHHHLPPASLCASAASRIWLFERTGVAEAPDLADRYPAECGPGWSIAIYLDICAPPACAGLRFHQTMTMGLIQFC